MNLSSLSREKLEALALRAIIDAAGGDQSLDLYHSVTSNRENIYEIANRAGLHRSNVYRRVNRVEEYLQSLRDRGLLPSTAAHTPM